MILKKMYPEIHLVQNELSKLAFIYLLCMKLFNVFNLYIFIFSQVVSNSIVIAFESFDHVSLVC